LGRSGGPNHEDVFIAPLIKIVSRTVTIAPMTTGSHPAPYRIPVRFRGRDGLILLDRLRILDKQRLTRRLGVITIFTLRHTLAVLHEMFEE